MRTARESVWRRAFVTVGATLTLVAAVGAFSAIVVTLSAGWLYIFSLGRIDSVSWFVIGVVHHAPLVWVVGVFIAAPIGVIVFEEELGDFADLTNWVIAVVGLVQYGLDVAVMAGGAELSWIWLAAAACGVIVLVVVPVYVVRDFRRQALFRRIRENGISPR